MQHVRCDWNSTTCEVKELLLSQHDQVHFSPMRSERRLSIHWLFWSSSMHQQKNTVSPGMECVGPKQNKTKQNYSYCMPIFHLCACYAWRMTMRRNDNGDDHHHDEYADDSRECTLFWFVFFFCSVGFVFIMKRNEKCSTPHTEQTLDEICVRAS